MSVTVIADAFALHVALAVDDEVAESFTSLAGEVTAQAAGLEALEVEPTITGAAQPPVFFAPAAVDAMV